jgi:hypothetical protein
MLRLRRLLAALPALALGAAVLVAPGRAGAAEHTWGAGLSFGYAALFGDSTWHGFGGGAHLSYGLNDTFRLLAEIDATEHPSPRLTVASGAVGAVYVLDVLEWVPWAGAEIGPAALVSHDAACGMALAEPCAALRLDLAIPFGLDYRVSPRFNVGLGGRFQMLMLGYSPWTTIGVFARAEYVWGK